MIRRHTHLVAALVVFTVWGAYLADAPPASATGSCNGSPADAIAVLPSGAIWDGGGQCYLVPAGLDLTKPVTLEDATLEDLSTSKPSRGGFQPVVKVESDNVTLAGLTIIGGNEGGGYHAHLVGQAGIKLVNAQQVSILLDSVSNTFGDCLELWAAAPKDWTPDQTTVNGFDGSNCGRDGISPSDVTDSTFSNVTIGNTGQASIDFESDIKAVGAGNLTFTSCSWQGFVFGESLTGPVNVNDSAFTGQILIRNKRPQPYGLTFTGGSLAVTPKAISGVSVRDMTVTFNNETFTRQLNAQGKPSSAPLWKAADGAHLTFSGGSLSAPLGTADSTSIVTINGQPYGSVVAGSVQTTIDSGAGGRARNLRSRSSRREQRVLHSRR